jgi:Glycosyltransferase family 87
VAFFLGLGVLLVVARPPARVVDPLAWGSAVAAMALTFEPWHDSLRLGQQNGIVFLLLALCLAALLARRDGLAGAALAAALIGKPSAALLGLYFLFARRWRAVLGAALVGVGAFLVTLPWTGWEPWRFYLLDKAPQILAGTPQQSNVALLALHARLFLPPDALSSFDAMPALPPAQTLTRVAQGLGLLALWRLTTTRWCPGDRSEQEGRKEPAGRAERGARGGTLAEHLELAFALVLSLSLVGHAWQSYVTWLIVAFVPFADPRAWAAVPGGPGRLLAGLAIAGYAGVALYDVALYKVIGNTSGAATVFASLPNVMLLVLAFVLAALRGAAGRRAPEPAVE